MPPRTARAPIASPGPALPPLQRVAALLSVAIITLAVLAAGVVLHLPDPAPAARSAPDRGAAPLAPLAASRSTRSSSVVQSVPASAMLKIPRAEAAGPSSKSERDFEHGIDDVRKIEHDGEDRPSQTGISHHP